MNRMHKLGKDHGRRASIALAPLGLKKTRPSLRSRNRKIGTVKTTSQKSTISCLAAIGVFLFLTVAGLVWGLDKLDFQLQGHPPPLVRAAREGDVAKIKQLIASGEDIDGIDAMGHTPLISAIEEGHDDCALAILAAHPNLEIHTTASQTAVEYAAKMGNDKIVRALMAVGTNVNHGALDLATKHCSISTIRAILATHADPNLGSPVIQAAEIGRVDLLKLLIQAGAHINARDWDGDTALILAAARGHLDCVQALVQAGAEIELHETATNDGRQNFEDAPLHGSALTYAAYYSHADVVKYLLQHGAKDRAQAAKVAKTPMIRAMLTAKPASH